jgi:hypothetical protein
MRSTGPASFLLPGLVGLAVGFALAFLVLSGGPPEALPSGLPRYDGPVSGETSSADRGGESLSGRIARKSTDAGIRDAGYSASDATIEQAIARAEVEPEGERRTGLGTETLGGIVVDRRGNPLADVLVVLQPTRNRDPFGKDTSDVGRGTPDDDSLHDELRDHARRWAETRGERVEARTGEDGRFRVQGLRSVSYNVSAYLEGWLFEVEPDRGVRPGVDVTVLGRPVELLEVDVLLPDGTRPEVAALTFFRSSNRWQGSGDTVRWSAAEPTIRLRERDGRVRALADFVRPNVENSPARLRSAEYTLTGDEERIELRLELQPGLWGELHVADGVFASGYAIKAIPAAKGTNPDRTAFEAVDDPDRIAYVRDGGGGVYSLADLDEGAYVLGVFAAGALILTETVQVGSELTRHDIDVRAPDPANSLHVVCVDSRGTRLRGVSFSMRSEDGRSFGRRAPAALFDPDGSYWITLDSIVGADEDFDATVAEKGLQLVVMKETWGAVTVPLRSGQREATVTFEEPCRLIVTVVGDVPLGSDEHAAVFLSNAGSESGQAIERESSMVGDDGRAVFEGLAPGAYRVELQVRKSRGWNNRSIAEVEVQLAAGGERTVSLSAPQVFALVVTTTGFKPRVSLTLAPKGDREWQNRIETRIDADGVARFENLVAGTYTLSGEGSSRSIEVTVPTGSVEFVCEKHDCMRVAISDESGRYYRAGLRAGDLIVAIGGEELGADNLWQTFWEHATKPDRPVVVLRGEERVEVALPAGESWYSQTDGDNGGNFDTAKR